MNRFFILLLMISLVACGGGKHNSGKSNAGEKNEGGENPGFTMKLQGKEFKSKSVKSEKTDSRLMIIASFDNNYVLELRINNYRGVYKYTTSGESYDEGAERPYINISLTIENDKYSTSTPSATCRDADEHSEYIEITKAEKGIKGEYEALVYPIFPEHIEAFGFEQTTISGKFFIAEKE